MHTHLTSSLNNTTPNFYTMQPPSSGPNSVQHQCDTIRYGTNVTQFGTAPMWHNSVRHQCDTIRDGTNVTQFGTAPMWHNSVRHQCDTIRYGTNVTQSGTAPMWHNSLGRGSSRTTTKGADQWQSAFPSLKCFTIRLALPAPVHASPYPQHVAREYQQ